MIIGFSGYARSGKDESAKALAELGYRRVAFADKLREFLYALNPIVDNTSNAHGAIRVSDVVDAYGWDGYKETQWGPEIRQLLQHLGTECGRQIISDTVWIDAALNGVDGDTCVTDCRFPNEAQAIKSRGGLMVRVERPGVGPANSHPSETALDDWPWDCVVENDGTIEELHQKVRRVVL